ncbi:tetratricopeptide repeat protein [Hahella ganghwensis]|uniref:tetratricopeptide repeat protein n=1 Tax=Hahella ganghwensis TaxID=286420 RepID=UPI0012FCDEC9|nr:hypothetical protein [Hahella ganghwensis]
MNLVALGNGVTDWESAFQFIFSNTSGKLGRPVSMASFLLSDQYWPAPSYSFKYVNLMIHLLCGVLIFYLVYRLLLLVETKPHSACLIAALVGGVWLIHPLNVSTVLYVIQRMTQLSALFSLCACIFYIVGRDRMQANRKFGLLFVMLAIMPFSALAVLSKENGILALLFLLIIEWVFFQKNKRTAYFKVIYFSGVIFPLLILVGYFVINMDSLLRPYENREFTLQHRLLTEPRILFDYIGYILAPRSYGSGLMHDDFVVSASLLEPWTTLSALVAIFVLVVAAFLTRVKAPLFSFGVLFFFGGHLLESTFLPLELYFEHRNYLPMVGVFLALGQIFLLVGRLIGAPIGRFLLVGTFCLYLVAGSFLTHQSARIWGDLFNLLTFWATEHPDSLRAQRVYGQFLGNIPEWADTGVRILSKAHEKFPDDISLPIAELNIACKHQVITDKDMDYVISRLDSASYNGGLLTVTKNFGDFYIDGKCASEESRGKALRIVEALTDASGMKGAQKAELLFFLGEKYAGQGNLNAAMKLLDEAALHQRISVVHVRQAQYLASAGLYDDALEYIEKAYLLDESRRRKRIVPSQADTIKQLEMKIRALKQMNHSADNGTHELIDNNTQ